MSKALIVTHGNDLEFLNIILNIIDEYRACGIFPEILNMSSVVKRQDAYNRNLLKFSRCESPEKRVLQHLSNSGVKVHNAHDYINPSSATFPSFEIEESVNESIKSTMISKSGNEHPVENRKYIRMSNAFKREANLTFDVVVNLVHAMGPYQQISVVNGRFPYQRAVQQAASYLQIRSMSFERGTYDYSLSPGLSTLDRYLQSKNYWHESFPATNRLIRQEEILSRFDGGSSHPNLINPQSWLEERRTPLGRGNQFNENWNKTISTTNGSRAKSISLFTSSLDEFAELGPEWKEAQWENQWVAFEYLIPIFYERGFEIILRVHPNLRNKHKEERIKVRRTLKGLKLKFPYLKIIDSSSNVDSYNLVENSAAVVVWNSTIGLESSLMGTPTACLSSCEYDLVADVQRWLCKEDVNVTELLESSVDKTKAEKFVSGMYLFDRPLNHLLSHAQLNLENYGRGLPLLANRWAFRGNNRIVNLVSILLPRKLFFFIRKRIRKFPLYKR
jgi:hypothetical protein